MSQLVFLMKHHSERFDAKTEEPLWYLQIRTLLVSKVDPYSLGPNANHELKFKINMEDPNVSLLSDQEITNNH